MSKTTELLNYIQDRGKISTAELAKFGADMFCFSVGRRARELRDTGLIRIRKMTNEEKVFFHSKNANWVYEINKVGEQGRLL